MTRIITITFLICTLFQTKGYTQITNPGFESVFFDGTANVPSNWNIDDYGAGLNSNAFSGSNALTVWNWYFYARGYAMNGNTTLFPFIMPGEPTMEGGEPIAVKPDAINGYYIYDTTLNGGAIDSAIVSITLSRYNSTSGTRELIGFGEGRLPVAANYTAFSVPVNYSSALMPDTVVVVLRSSVNGFCHNTSPGTCLYFTVDDLTLSTSSGLIDFSEKNDLLNVYPNPANDLVTISILNNENESGIIRILDMIGKIIFESETSSSMNKITADVSGFPKGMYTISHISNSKITSSKLILE